jgi:hypothetical protein
VEDGNKPIKTSTPAERMKRRRITVLTVQVLALPLIATQLMRAGKVTLEPVTRVLCFC